MALDQQYYIYSLNPAIPVPITEGYAQAQPENPDLPNYTSWNPSSDTTILSNPDADQEVVAILSDIIRSRHERDVLLLERQLLLLSDLGIKALRQIVFDRAELINVRAFAARYFTRFIHLANFHHVKSSNQHYLAEMRVHRSPTIRLGVLLGFVDAKNWTEVQEFCSDTHPFVAEEAQDVLLTIAQE